MARQRKPRRKRARRNARTVDMPVKGEVSWGPSEYTWEDTWDWYKRNKLSGRHPKIVLPKVTGKWLMRRLPQVGFVPGRILGTGCLGVVFELLSLDEKPTGYVGKITKDPAEVAAVHRIQGARIGHLSIFPETLGGWQVPGGRWLIIREGLPGGCLQGWRDYPEPAWVKTYKDAGLCLFMQYASDVYDAPEDPVDEDEQEELNRAWKLLTPEGRQMVTTLYSGLKRASKAGIYFGDLNSSNIRFRHRPDGGRDLVVSDFGMNVGPACTVPLARNPQRRGRR